MTPNRASQCLHRCPEGNSCILNADVPHTLHICHRSSCECHGRQRYAGAMLPKVMEAPRKHVPISTQEAK